MNIFAILVVCVSLLLANTHAGGRLEKENPSDTIETLKLTVAYYSVVFDKNQRIIHDRDDVIFTNTPGKPRSFWHAQPIAEKDKEQCTLGFLLPHELYTDIYHKPVMTKLAELKEYKRVDYMIELMTLTVNGQETTLDRLGAAATTINPKEGQNGTEFATAFAGKPEETIFVANTVDSSVKVSPDTHEIYNYMAFTCQSSAPKQLANLFHTLFSIQLKATKVAT